MRKFEDLKRILDDSPRRNEALRREFGDRLQGSTGPQSPGGKKGRLVVQYTPHGRVIRRASGERAR